MEEINNPEQQPTNQNNNIKDDNIIAAIGYIFILCLVPLLLKKDSQFAQFHGKQGLVLTVVAVIAWILSMILWFIPVIGWLINLVMFITIIVLAVLGILNALKGEYWEMPVLGEFAKKIKL